MRIDWANLVSDHIFDSYSLLPESFRGGMPYMHCLISQRWPVPVHPRITSINFDDHCPQPVHHTNKYDILLSVVRLVDSIQVIPSCASKRPSTIESFAGLRTRTSKDVS